MARHSFHFIVFVLLCVFLPKVSNDESSPLNSTRPARELLVSSHRESLRIVHEASLLSGQRRSGAAPTWLRQSEPETREVTQAAEVFHATLQVLESTARPRYERDVTAPEPLSWEDVELIAELSKCPPVPHPAACLQSPLDKYRSISGLCNNRQNPLWGAANTPLVRWLPAEYEDGEREPKGWNRGRLHNGFQLPPTGASVSGARSCMPFHRSAPACPVGPGSDVPRARRRQQMNAITSFIDASPVYGHTPRRGALLRDLSGRSGKLAVNERFRDPGGRAYLPFASALPSACLQTPRGERVECFGAGDGRANEGLPLASLHTLWLREHNRMAGELRRVNAHWSPETVYQEARKVVGALHQIITMRDYVPKIIGQAAFDSYIGPYRGYDPATDPSASNVFATAAFRFGHATIPPVLRRLNESFQTHEHFGDLRLHQTFFSPWRIVKEGGIEPILRGAFGTAASAGSADMLLTEEITERLVVLNLPRPMDLASLNLQRGRDHALPGYNDWRSFCGLERIKDMEGLKGVVRDHAVAEKMARIYKHPDNVDVWLGGLVEHMPPGSRTGPLFACLIGKQMKALRDGDRFWWEAEGVFSQRQRAQLLKASLSRIICDNSDIREVPPDSFRFGRYPYDYIPCDRVPSIDLEAWQEETDHDMEQCGIPRMIKNGDFILSSTNGKLVALYSCYHGFKLKGAAAVVCQGNQWSDQPPQCTGNHR
uniref:LOW QUALITY PROTEIN: thyroid peroxidase n=1 Tax=Gasterosteus aculeatus aculeatus TaxID=481459 RepID=UPI001A995651|nr:LOW QUALITY PROTEIN: thyroid peroxidase [Gasterosteus aculeatus aculeatus]